MIHAIRMFFKSIYCTIHGHQLTKVTSVDFKAKIYECKRCEKTFYFGLH